MSTLRDKIRGKIKSNPGIEKEIYHSELWGDIEIRTIRLKEMTRITTNASDEEGNVIQEIFTPAFIIATCFVPESDPPEQLFDETDVEMINNLSSNETAEIIKIANRLNGYGEEFKAELKKS